ncbi:MAG TPA: hypothetical protein VFI45_00010 [Candidatus Acidoferrum sp.]|nr:hypothetical protein [Candidatus Acidoferrum sp.]
MKRPFFFSRTLLIVIGVIFAILAYAYLWGTQTVLAFTLRNQARKIAILNEKPVPLPSIAASSDQGTKLVHAGFSFEVPWNDLDLQKSKFGGNIAVFAFQSGRVISFFGPSENHEDLLSTFEKSIGDNKGTLKKLFGPQATETNYAFHRAILEETADKVSPFEAKREALRSSMLLMLKATSSVGGETGLFQIQSQDWKGFQFDDPSRNPQVTLEVYDREDRHIEIVLHSGKDVSSSLAQADINRTFQTLGATSDPQTIPLENKFVAKAAAASGASSH